MRLVLIAVAVLLAYPVLGTLALWTGLVERLARSEDLRVEIENPAYTIWPGRIHMKHVRVLVNGDTQFILEGKDLEADFQLFSLIKRKIHLTKLAAHGVRYQMRTQVKTEKGIEERIAAFPPLADLPGAKVMREKAAKKTEKREAAYTVEVEGIDIRVDELWFFEYRYLGDGRLRGGFLVGPQQMQVSTAVQDIGPGELRFGADRVIAKNVRGQITADIPKINPEEHADVGFFELVTARSQLRAELENLTHLGAYLHGIDVRKGGGPLAVDLYMDRGWLGPKSRVDYETESIGVIGHGFGVETDLDLHLDAVGENGLPLMRSASKQTYVSLARAGHAFTVQIQKHHEQVALDRIRLTGATKPKRALLRMPTIVSRDLDDLGVLFPEGTEFESKSGEALASLSLDMDERYWVRGPLDVTVKDADFKVTGVQIHGDALLRTRANLNPKLEQYMLDSFVLSLRNVGMHVGDENVDGWWMDVTSPRLALWNAKEPFAESTLSIRAKDLEPVLEGLAEKDKLNDLIAKFTSLDDFRARLTLRKKGPANDLTLESESDVWDASGRFYTDAKRTLMAFVVGGQAVSLGVAKLDGNLELVPMAKTDWLNAQLRRFPKPLEQLARDKP